MDAVVAAIVGALSGGVVSYIVSRVVHVRTRRELVYDTVESALEDLERACCTYWRSDGRHAEQETQIKQFLERVDLRVQALSRERAAPQKRAAWVQTLDQLSDDITGGAFETTARRSDCERVSLIKCRCAAFKDELHAAL